jgi:aryl-alcohol dehydrogenase-like predicted oxidoreductase
MRQSICGEIRTSVLGFGCGSVLGRVGRGTSLRAMGTAWDEGITLFDTARSYGYGGAEAVLGEFLRGKREQAIVATKFGITPERQSALKRLVVPLARAAMQVPGVRGLRRSRGSREMTLGRFTVAGLRESLETSLRELHTDRIDVLFLHEATASAMRQQELMAELDALVQAGKVLRVGLYGGADVIAEGMTNGPATLTAMQFGGNYSDPAVAGFTQQNPRGLFLIANHPFGGEQRVARTKAVLAAMSTDETVPAELRDKQRGADWQAVLEVILGVILDGTGTHVLVFSMMGLDHLRANTRAIESCRFSSADLALIRRRLLSSSSLMAGE